MAPKLSDGENGIRKVMYQKCVELTFAAHFRIITLRNVTFTNRKRVIFGQGQSRCRLERTVVNYSEANVALLGEQSAITQI